MLAAGHIGVEANHIGQRHAVLGEDRGDIGEAEVGLRFAIGRNLSASALMPSWPEVNTSLCPAGTAMPWL